MKGPIPIRIYPCTFILNHPFEHIVNLISSVNLGTWFDKTIENLPFFETPHHTMTSESARMSLNHLKYPLMPGSILVHFENLNFLPRRTGTHRLRPTFQGFFVAFRLTRCRHRSTLFAIPAIASPCIFTFYNDAISSLF